MGTVDLAARLLDYAPPLVAALLHSLWQAALLAAGCKVVLLAVPFRRPHWRYGIALACLGMVVLAFLVTLRLETRPAPPAALTPPTHAFTDAPAMARTPQVANPTPAVSAARSLDTAPRRPTWQALLGGVWLAGVLLMVLRAARILHGETRLAGTATPVDDPAVLALLAALRKRLGVARRIAVATIDAASSPAVVGVVAPVILVPAALLTGAPPDHLRAVLAHELAHIRRWDVLVNLCQLLVEALFFHNPCVWLLSVQVRKEREACCDAIAAACCGGAPAYARALVEVGQQILSGGTAVAFARPHGLADRVRRLLGLRPTAET